MSDDSQRQHGTEDGKHSCLFCARVYECAVIHENPYDRIRQPQGSRGCPECRTRNLMSLARHEKRRREKLYAQ